ncbi:hypothetical protein RBB79_00635 [Tunturiibacter empetritectus]|uniref:Exo-alpha-sialidase n=2 Tax=Tunturiibacter TaxID=3154218 RepID=A0A852VB17_9BACT|nr:hypothetical protein [Edaphobacter lichenicola]NYF87989.1 hypothetical protein [Edaphobacter lichenicola]
MNRLVSIATPSSLLLATLILSSVSYGQDKDLTRSYTWKPVQIGSGGFVRGFAVHPKDPNTRVARADVDNIYRWDAATGAWAPLKISSAFSSEITGAPTSGVEGAVALDPNDPKVILVAYSFTRSSDIANTNPSINMNVYRSIDSGATFTASNLSLTTSLSGETRGERLAIDPTNSNLVYFGTPGNGLWRSLDGGLHFESITGNGAPSASTDVALPRFDPNCGTASLLGNTVSKCVFLTLTNGSILRSSDGGKSFKNISAGQPVDGSPGFTTIDSNGSLWTTDGRSANVYRYTRAGIWTTFTTPISSIGGIAVDPSNPRRIFVISGSGALARSTDGGAVWTNLGGVFFSESQPIQWLAPSAIRPQQHYLSTGGIYFDSNGTLYIPGGNDGVVSTVPNDKTDAAANPPVWASAPGIEELVATNAVLPPGQRPILAGDDETLFTINDPDRLNADHYPIDLWGYNPALGYNNNGLSSAQDINFVPNQPRYIAVASDNFFAGDPQKQQFSGYSEDGGQTWNLFNSITYGTNPCILWGGTIAVSARAKGHVGDAAGADNLVRLPTSQFTYGPVAPAPFYSKDGGATWTQTTSFDNAVDTAFTGQSSTKQQPCEGNTNQYTYMPPFWGDWVGALVQHSVVADPVKPGVFYLNLAAGGFWKSIDGGVTWAQPAGASVLPLKMHHGKMYAEPGISGHLWLVDGREGATAHGLYRSTDGGNTFSRNPNFDFAWALTLGKPADGSKHPAIYVYGLHRGDGQWGVFQSVDEGKTFNRIANYPTGLFDYVTTLAASQDIFGQVYIGFGGNGYAYSTYEP